MLVKLRFWGYMGDLWSVFVANFAQGVGRNNNCWFKCHLKMTRQPNFCCRVTWRKNKTTHRRLPLLRTWDVFSIAEVHHLVCSQIHLRKTMKIRRDYIIAISSIMSPFQWEVFITSLTRFSSPCPHPSALPASTWKNTSLIPERSPGTARMSRNKSRVNVETIHKVISSGLHPVCYMTWGRNLCSTIPYVSLPKLSKWKLPKSLKGQWAMFQYNL